MSHHALPPFDVKGSSRKNNRDPTSSAARRGRASDVFLSLPTCRATCHRDGGDADW